MHKANHPDTKHFCKSVWDVAPKDVAGGRPVGFAWFSPDCTHFSRARGGKPRKKNIRDLAWVVVQYAQDVSPRVIMLENVEEFQTWGPLSKKNLPIKSKAGKTFRSWVRSLEDLGYEVDWRILRACDYGTPTIRKRLFIVARRDGEPITWPEATHVEPSKVNGKPAFRTAAEIIDWGLPCPSIFTRARPLADKTMQRIAKGLEKFVFNCADPFVIPVTHSGGLNRAHDVREPLRTVTGANRGELALVSPFVAKHYTGVTGIDARKPTGTITAKDHHSLVAANLVKWRFNSAGMACGAPLHTITAGGKSKRPAGAAHAMGLATSHLIKFRGTCAHGQAADKPLATITGGGTHLGEVRAFLTKFYSSGGTAQSLRVPAHTITAKARLGLVTVQGIDYQIVDIGLRMLQPHELFRAQGFPDTYITDLKVNGKKITKAEQVRLCGNSVCPQVTEALVRANYTPKPHNRRGTNEDHLSRN